MATGNDAAIEKNDSVSAEISEPPNQQAELESFDIRVDTLLGRTITVSVRKNQTVGQIKLAIQRHFGCETRDQGQALLRRQPLQRQGYKEMDDKSTIGQAGLKEGDRLLLVPKMRSGPINYRLKEPADDTKTAKLFVNADQETVDRMMQESGIQKVPGSRYVLVQIDDKLGILELTDNNGDKEKTEESEKKAAEENVKKKELTPEELKQNEQTRKRMEALRADMEKCKQKRRAMFKPPGDKGPRNKGDEIAKKAASIPKKNGVKKLMEK